MNDLDVLASASSFESVGACITEDGEMTAGDERVEISPGQVSPSFFSTMRVRAATGRVLSADDFRQRADVVVVSDRLRRTHFAGRSLRGAVLTVEQDVNKRVT